ncbi:hypothetical protein ACUYOF_00175 [Photobacterium ganghwense]|uniref:hypothetical protein n=1 Tax=Photobacterium ganghwense TaxID=320778 RepID=UPI004055A79A
MQFKFSALTASLIAALSLTGCGSDSSDSSKVITPDQPSSKEITVIDGYLTNALVCADRNNNKKCDADEVIGETNASGRLTIEAADAKHSLIAKVVAGKTSDSDKPGVLGSSYELIANADSEVVTPFTTMAAVQDKSMDALAAELNLDIDMISGDYVAAKGNAKTQEAAQKAHLMARSLTTELAPTIEQNDAQALADTAKKLGEAIEESINKGANLDKIIIEIDESGNANIGTMFTSLSDYLEGNTLQLASLNKAYAADEGIFQIQFNNGEMTITSKKDGTSTSEYSIEGNALVHQEDGETSKETFIYISEQTSLAVTPQNDLFVWTTKDLSSPQPITAEMVEGQTWYFLDDDSSSFKPDPVMAAMAFGKDGMVTITEGEESFDLPWKMVDSELHIDFPEGDRDMQMQLLTKDSNVMTITDTLRKNMSFSLLFKDKAMAESVYKKWGEEI